MKHLHYYEHTIEDEHTQPQVNDYVIVKDITLPKTISNNVIGQTYNRSTRPTKFY